jgi:hypothetical protein
MLSRDTKVFVVAFHSGNQHWLVKAATKRDERTGRIVQWPAWGNPSEAKSLPLEYATVFRRRMLEEHMQETHFTLAAGSSEFVEEPKGSTPAGEDTRQPMSYRGILARPGINTRTGIRCWYAKIYEGPSQLESVSSSSPEAVVDRVFEMGLQDKAEKVPVPQAPQQAQAMQKPAGPRVRPGDLHR